MALATPEILFKEFEKLGIEVSTQSHEPVFTSAEGMHLKDKIQGAHCKSLFLKTKKHAYYLLIMLDDTRLDLKGLAHTLKSDRLSFASDDRLMEKLGIKPGSVTPFAVINNTDKDVNVVLDYDMMQHDILNYHPLENDKTTSIARGDLEKFLTAQGYTPLVLELPKLPKIEEAI